MQLNEILSQPLVFQKRFFKFLGEEINIKNEQDQLVLFVKQKAFKIRENIKVFTDSSKSQEVLAINARHIIDFSAAYDVVDPTTKDKVGALRRKGLSSLIRDKWELLDINDNVVGDVSEDQTVLAILRRLSSIFTVIVPQSYSFNSKEGQFATLTQRRNPIIFKADFIHSDGGLVDPRLALAAAVLLMTIEGRQN